MRINLASEVQHYLGRELTDDDRAFIVQCAADGLVNPVDIAVGIEMQAGLQRLIAE